MNPQRKIVAALAFALALCGATAAVGDDAPEPAAEPAEGKQTDDEARAKLSYWLLEEFDWGDDREVVGESILFDPYFSCKGIQSNPCIIVSTVIDGEQLLVNFQHDKNELWQVVVLTPDLGLAQANAHIPRVSRILVDYVTRLKGEPTLDFSLPDFDSLALSDPQVTHFWGVDDLEVRVMVGRRDTDRFYVGVFFSDPVRGKVARPQYLNWLAASDKFNRRKWVAKKEQRANQKGKRP